MPTGPELKEVRQRTGVHQAAVARAYGASRARIAKIENQANVQPETARKYLAAVATYAPVAYPASGSTWVHGATVLAVSAARWARFTAYVRRFVGPRGQQRHSEHNEGSGNSLDPAERPVKDRAA